MNALLTDGIFDSIQIPLDDWFADAIGWVTSKYRPAFQSMEGPLAFPLGGVSGVGGQARTSAKGKNGQQGQDGTVHGLAPGS